MTEISELYKEKNLKTSQRETEITYKGSKHRAFLSTVLEAKK